MHRLQSYLKFLWSATNHHGVHSPFVYRLVTQCLYDQKNYPEYTFLKSHRNELESGNSSIPKSAYSIFRPRINTIDLSTRKAKLVFRLSHYFQPDTILEIGTSSGLATTALALGAKKAKTSSIYTSSNNLTQWDNSLDIKPTAVAAMDFSTLLSEVHLKGGTTLSYFNKPNSKLELLNEFERGIASVQNNSVWIFKGIHQTKELESAWETISKHPKVKVSIDTYAFGIVFFRSEQEKEHFVIRL